MFMKLIYFHLNNAFPFRFTKFVAASQFSWLENFNTMSLLDRPELERALVHCFGCLGPVSVLLFLYDPSYRI